MLPSQTKQILNSKASIFNTKFDQMQSIAAEHAMTNFTMYMYFRRKKMPFQIEYEEYNQSLSEVRTYIHQRTRASRRNYDILQ